MLFCVLNHIVSYDRSKCVSKVGTFNRRWFFVASQNFHSIVTVVPLHVSNSFRVLKKLTVSHPPDRTSFCEVFFED
jgi:hypothetical protein